MSKITPKAFIEAILNFPSDPAKAKTFFQDKRMTQLEKKILAALFLVRDNKNTESLDILQSLPPFGLSECQTYKNYLHALVLNNLGRYDESLLKYQEAYKDNLLAPLRSLEFMILNNLFILYLNLVDKTNAKATLKRMMKLKDLTNKEQMSINRAIFNMAILNEDFEEASLALKEIEKSWDCLLPAQASCHLFDEFDFYIKTRQLTLAEKCLTKMKSYRKYTPSAYYNYMKTLLSFIKNRTPIYFTESEFDDFAYIKGQLKLLSALEGGQLETAQHEWQKLQGMYPKLFMENFVYLGGKDLFGQCLERLKPMISGKTFQFENLSPKKEEAILQILSQTDAPISKDKLYQLLWGEDIQDKNDLRKLAQLVYHIKKTKHINIASRKGCYYLEKLKTA